MSTQKDVSQEEVSRFLDKLRESGKINMFGAPAVLQQAFSLDKKTASAMFWVWADNFSK